MGGISSKGAGKLRSNKGFNGNELQSKEFSDGSGLELYDFNARTYDQQIGRFIQIDPETEVLQESFSPFHFGINNPILHDDPDGKNPYIIYRGLRLIYEVAVFVQKQGRAVPASMALKNVSDNTSTVKQVMDLKTFKEVNDVIIVKSESKTESKSEEPKGGTYVLHDDEGKVQRSGRTIDLKRREGEHAKNEKTKDLKFQVDKKTDNKDAQRGREQEIHEKHNPPMNKIKSISDKNPNKQKYLDAAKELEKPKA
ncbi:MAG: hypothetical protein B7Y37_01665 [Sphingobacteriia bacterium 28-36-52]|nr:MAG: hypothetical protein B7Y37_01665 [Sphingobacteriia bacterium 28-36-52]